MSSYIIADIATFHGIGTDTVIIIQITPENNKEEIHYVVDIDNEYGCPVYYSIADNEKIQKLFNRLKECGSEVAMKPDDYYLFKLVGPKFYEVAKKKEEQTKGLRVAIVYDESPIGSKYFDITKLPSKEYGEMFEFYERNGKGGFPVF